MGALHSLPLCARYRPDPNNNLPGEPDLNLVAAEPSLARPAAVLDQPVQTSTPKVGHAPHQYHNI